MDWAKVSVGEYMIFETYSIVNPEEWSDVYGDRWLCAYTSALFKEQWGNNLTKFAGVQLPGGITLDGIRILQEATAEIEKLESEMIRSYSLPVSDMIG